MIEELQFFLYFETEDAYLVSEGDAQDVEKGKTKKIWLPKSQIENVVKTMDPKSGADLLSCDVPEWLAEEKELL